MRVIPLSLNELFVEWGELESDSYRLLRSNSPDGDFEIILDNTNITFYTDKDVNLFDVSIRYYYKVESYKDNLKLF